jgi:Domain of unknown function (DUF4399)
MKKILTMPAIILMGLMGCNSGSNTDTTATTDSSSMKMSTDSIHADTSHSAMNMASMDSLPAIPEGAKVSFKNLKNGETVSSPLKVEMEAKNISIDTAGKVKQGSGHFHILIDAEDSTPSGVVVAKDSTHLHFGKAQKEATLTLTPGKHKLALQLADGIHRSYGSKLSEAISVNVK